MYGEYLERVVGLLLVITSNTLVVTAKCDLGLSWSVKAQARVLVTHGMYSKLRNPIYVFHVLTTVGAAMVMQWRWLWILVPIEIAVQTWRAHSEALVLRARFGDRYEAYRKRTWF